MIAIMTAQLLTFLELTDKSRKKVQTFSKVRKKDRVEVHVFHSSGKQETATIPPEAAALIGTMLEHLKRGDKIALLAGDQELSPNEAASILGISRPLVVHRMEIGDLPFRYVGKHRRTKLTDVLALKHRLDEQQAAFDALAEETEKLIWHGL